MSGVTPAETAQRFAEAVVAQERCTDEGDALAGNEYADRYIEAARQLLSGGSAAIDAFATLLNHPREGVRVMAAAFLLKERTSAAVATLRPIAKGRGIAALGAQETLKRFERGDLEIRW